VGVQWTRENLDKALVQLRPHLKFYESSAQAAHGQFSNQLSESDRNTVDAWLKTQGRLVADGDDGLRNRMNIVTWLQEKNMPISTHNLSLALSNIVNRGHLGHPPLVWKKVEQKKQEREVSNAEIATWRSRAEGARVTTPSGLVLRTKTEEIQKIVVNGADGKIDWKATAQARELAASRGGRN
jgi:hypothetical protein